MDWIHATGRLTLDRPRIVAIINVTPDSFSDGGRLATVDDARRCIDLALADGADVIDVGGESTRPAATAVGADEELRRVIPVVESAVADHPGVVVSIDTVKARVASAAMAAGASIINDVSAMRLDASMAGVAASSAAGVVLMHSRGEVSDMASFAHAEYGEDPVAGVIEELRGRVAAVLASGVDRARIVIDPGIGFAKRGAHSVALLHGLGRLERLGFPILVGVSRERFIGEITGVASPAGRLSGTIGANVAALERGARLFRVHDVRANRDALEVAWAIGLEGEARHEYF